MGSLFAFKGVYSLIGKYITKIQPALFSDLDMMNREEKAKEL